MEKTKLRPLNLGLSLEPVLHFHAEIDGVEYVLPLEPHQAQTLGATLILLAEVAEVERARGSELPTACWMGASGPTFLN